MTDSFERTRASGLGRQGAVWGLAPLLLALWAGQATAVTLDGPSVTRAAGWCAAAVRGLPESSHWIPAPASETTMVADTSPAGDAPGVPTWGEPEISRAKILRLACAAAHREVSSFGDILATDGHSALARSMLAEPAQVASGVSFSRPTAIDASLGERRAMVMTVPRLRPKASEPMIGNDFRFPWWSPLPLLPGLLAVVVSVGGVMRNRPSPQLV